MPIPPISVSTTDTGWVTSSVGPVNQGGLNINSSTNWLAVAGLAVVGLIAAAMIRSKRKKGA